MSIIKLLCYVTKSLNHQFKNNSKELYKIKLQNPQNNNEASKILSPRYCSVPGC